MPLLPTMWLAEQWARDQGRRWRRLLALALVLSAAGGLTTWLLSREPEAWLREGASRPLEARLSVREADLYRPYAPSAGAPAPLPLRAMARLERREDWSRLAAALLLPSSVGQAEAVLDRVPPSPARDNDRAVVAWSQGHFEQALELLDELLADQPSHPQALWNRGLVLRDLELPLLAADTFDHVAALGEPGWSEEARRLAAALREPELARGREWKAARAATLALIDQPEAPLPLQAARQVPLTVRALFYEAVRAASSRERVLALLPLAEVLDQRTGGSPLRDWALRMAEQDFAHREPLARGYGLLVRGRYPDPELFASQLLFTAEEDLALGALSWTQTMGQHSDAFVKLARGSGEPGLELLAERELARKANSEGLWREEERHLKALLNACEKQVWGITCLQAQRLLATLYTAHYQLAEAQEHALSAWRRSRLFGEWGQERANLHAMAQLARFRMNLAAGRAYLEESLLRDPEGCQELNYIRRNLAIFAFGDLRLEQARHEMDEALACDQPVGLMGAWILGELARMKPRPGDDERLRQSLAQVRQAGESPGRQAYATFIEGRFTLEHDREAGRALLRQAIAESQRRPRADTEARDARAGSYSSLVVDAGRSSAWGEVAALVAESLELPTPTRCALAVAVDVDRAVMVALGPHGEQQGHFEASHYRLPAEDGSQLVPPALVEGLRGCERVDVLALSPVDNRPDLLPPDMAWSYRAPRLESPSRPAAPLHLIVADVEAPATLRLPRLRGWSLSPDPRLPRLMLSGADATPTRVLAAMASATEIEIHAHGLVDPSVSIASLVALAPEAGARYALTADEVRAVRLEGAPVVFLAACGAARATPFLKEALTLPKAFVAAGAQAVFASTVDIPDSAGSFFAAVREHIRTGTPPALALRNERQAWLHSFPGATWVNNVLLYE